VSAIDVRNVHKRYRDRVAVDDVSLSIDPGEIVGVLGRNGAGKTTTVEMISGLRAPDRGSVSVFELDPRRDRARVRSLLGVQLQQADLHAALTVRELARLYRTFYREGNDPDDAIASVGLEDQSATRFEKLSGGQQQRLSIALALIGRPRAVVLDELTTGLDPEARRRMWALVTTLREDGVAVLLVSHLMEEVERLCDRVALLEGGRVVAHDSPEGLIEQAALSQRVRFRAETDRAPQILAGLPGVESVDREGEHVVVAGSGDLLQVVSTALVNERVVATETRLERPSLEDAFLALTGRTLSDREPEEAR
jgi:ABC-2 type transport system ATP-binding protein